MKLTEWIGVLRHASQAPDPVELIDGAHRIATRAGLLTLGESSFVVTRTTTGVKITASNPSVRAARALHRAVGEEIGRIKGSIAQQERERLQG